MRSIFCPNCGKGLKVEEENPGMFCQYCGYKIQLADESNDDGTACVIRGTQNGPTIACQNKKEYVQKKKKWAKSTSFGAVGAIIAICLILLLVGNAEVRGQEEKLQSIVDQILIDIENEDFTSAHIKANSLYWNSGWTSEGEKKWDAIRNEVIRQIKEAEKRAN